MRKPDFCVCTVTAQLICAFVFGIGKNPFFSDQTNKQNQKMSHRTRKPTICISVNKDTDQLCCHREADQRLYFRYTDRTIPPKFQASQSFLRLYKLVCVRLVGNPNCWFSHAKAQNIL